jgi:nicotinate-nucleotide adenylyltransferase
MNNGSKLKGARLGILGGTFNPIHNAHLEIARAAKDHFKLDRVLFIPAHLPPHKEVPDLSAMQRVEMLQFALKGCEGLELSTAELDRKGVSYTVDTVRRLRADYPDSPLYFIIGDDSLVQLHQWKSVGELMELCDFITVSRPGVDLDALRRSIHFDWETTQQLLANRIEACNLQISSTSIRELVREGNNIDHLVPAVVAEYIRENKFYI